MRHLWSDIRLGVRMIARRPTHRSDGLDPPSATDRPPALESAARVTAGRTGTLLAADLRSSVRRLWQTPGFVALAIVVMGLGIGANTAVLSLLNGVWFPTIPYRHGEEIVRIFTYPPKGTEAQWVSYPEAIDYRDRTTAFSELGVASDGELVVVGDEGAPAVAEVVSAGMFSLLDIPPALGRSLGPGDDAPGAEPAVMLCYATWERRFGRDPGVLGRTVRINGLPATIVGVAPRGFTGTLILFSTDYLLPLETGRRAVTSHAYEDRSERTFRVFARLKPGVTIEEARVRLAATAAVLGRTYPTTNADRTVTALSAAAVRLDPNFDRALLPVSAVMTVVSALVLLVACSNLAGLLLVRASSRVREIGIRVAMGASRLQVLRLLLIESALLGLMGGLAGVVLARLLASSLATIPDWLPVPMNLDFKLDAKVLATTALLSAGTGLVFGLAPALRAMRPDVLSAIRAAAPVLTLGRRRFTLHNVLVVVQLGVSVIFLMGAAMLAQGLARARTSDPGFDVRPTSVAVLDVGRLARARPGADQAFLDRFRQRLAAAAGVDDVAIASRLPLGIWGATRTVVRPVEEPAQSDERRQRIDYGAVSAGYFAVMDVTILRGRPFVRADDSARAPRVAIVSETAARRFWGGLDVVGRRIVVGPREEQAEAEVVGVARDTDVLLPGRRGIPYVYVPFSQRPSTTVAVIVRTSGDPGACAALMRRELMAGGEDVLLLEARPMRDHVAQQFLVPEASASLLLALGIATTAIAAIGLFGLVAFSVARRTREIGIRVAVGATARQVVGPVVREAIGLVGVGLLVGLPAAGLTMRPFAQTLVGAGAAGPWPYVAVAALLLTAAAAASFVPAKRAAGVNPTSALRCE